MKKPKIKQHIPSLFTLTNMFFGFLAILNIQNGRYDFACYLILAAGVFDSIDGKLARLFGISTNFGIEIDSLADMISFCLAPSVLIYTLYSQGLPGISGELIASTPLIMGAIRLARFNIAQSDSPSGHFIGLPTPATAIAITSIVLFTEHIKLDNPEYTEPRLLLPIILGITFLGVSKIRYAKFPQLSLKAGFKNNLSIFGISIFGITFITGILLEFHHWVLMGSISCYVLSGIVIRLIKPTVVEISDFTVNSK